MRPSSEMDNRVNVIVAERIFYIFWSANVPSDEMKVRELGNSLELVY